MICLGGRLRVLTGAMRILGNEKAAMIYGIASHGGVLEERFLFLDSMCTRWKPAAEPSPCSPLLQGQRIKKAIRKYIHTHRESKEQSFLQLSMSWVIFIFPSHFPAYPWVNYIGSKHWLRCALGSALPDGKGQRRSFCFFGQVVGETASPCFHPKQKRKWGISQKTNRREE